MRLSNFAAIIVLTGASLFLTACGGSGSTSADEAAITEINKKWQELIVTKNAKAISELYAEDGQMLPPNSPKAVGRPALEQAWNGFVGIPGMALTFETEKFIFAKSGDLAVEVGTYKFITGEGATQVTDIGKSIVTWRKQDGKWQVLADMFSSNTSPPTPAPVDVPGAAAFGIEPAPPMPPDIILPGAPATPAPVAPPTPPAN